MSDIKRIQGKVMKFVTDREWDKKYSLKNLAIDISIESSELLEVFQWCTDEESMLLLKTEKKEKIEEELADVFWAAFVFAKLTDLDIERIIDKKIVLTNKRYPLDKSKGNNKKHTEL